MGYQSSLLGAGLSVVGAASSIKSGIDDKKAVAAKEAAAAAKEAEAKEESIITTQNQLHIANARVSQDDIALQRADKVANSMFSTTDRRGRQQFRNTAGRFVKRYDYQKAQESLQRAQEQSTLAKSIAEGYRAKLEKLKGGNI